MTCYVYLIAHVNSGQLKAPVKVGIASSPEGRLKSLQTGNPRELAIACSFAVPAREFAKFFEGAFHDIQREKRLVGEWFDISVRDAITRICFYMDLAFNSFLQDEELIAEAREASGVNAAMRLIADREALQ
jgi:hypothetical protein